MTGSQFVTSELWRRWKSRTTGNKKIKIEILHYKKLLEWTIQILLPWWNHLLSAAWHWLAAATRPVRDEVSFKKLCFSASVRLSSKHKIDLWLYAAIIYFFLSSCKQWINQKKHPHESLQQQFVVLRVHLGVLVALSIAECAMLPPLKHSFRLSVGRLCLTLSTQMNHQPPTDGRIVTSDSEEGLWPKHQALCCPNRLKQKVRECTGKDFLSHKTLSQYKVCFLNNLIARK